MKKYFLLATTALLLGTSNVMAADLNLGTVDMQVSVTLEPAYGVEKISDMNWGTFYVDYLSFSDTTIATFNSDGSITLGDKTAYHEGDHTPGKIKLAATSSGGKTTPTPVIKNLTNDELVFDGVDGTLSMKNIHLEKISESDYGTAVEYIVTGELFGKYDHISQLNTHTATLTIGLDY